MNPHFFATPAEFRKWLERNHESAPELLVGFYRKASGRPSMTWPESVDEALCFGWIDGIRRTIDDESYSIRFTPRRAKKSIWSRINIARMEQLIAEGRVAPAGLKAFQERDPADASRYSFEQGDLQLAPEHEKRFRANRAAWRWFSNAPASYRKPAIWWVLSAKLEATSERRLGTLIADSEQGVRVKHLRRS